MKLWGFVLTLIFVSQSFANPISESLSKELKTESEKHGIKSAGLIIYKFGNDSTTVFKESLGGFSFEEPLPIASATKWITTSVILSLVDQGKITLDSTTEKILGKEWKGDAAHITLRELLSFTSGLDPKDSCVLRPFMPLSKCVNEIASNKLSAKPGSTFNYGNTHLQVAGRMAEVSSGKDFSELFRLQIADILGWEKSVRYYTFPRKRVGSQPLLAGGLFISTNDYVKFLQMLGQKGVFNGKRLLSESIIAEMEKDQFNADTKVINSPMMLDGVSVHYGLGHWVESADIQSSGGAFGFFPWLDRKNKYLAIYATVGEPRTAQKSYAIARALRPTIEKLIK